MVFNIALLAAIIFLWHALIVTNHNKRYLNRILSACDNKGADGNTQIPCDEIQGWLSAYTDGYKGMRTSFLNLFVWTYRQTVTAYLGTVPEWFVDDNS